MDTASWAQSFGIQTAVNLPAMNDCHETFSLSARQIAVRTIVLQGVVAVAYGVDELPIIEWFHKQGVWSEVSPNERAFLLKPRSLADVDLVRLQWRQEAEWTLLWVIGKVDSLGLPNRQCSSARLVDEIMPALGSDIKGFLSSSELRPTGDLLAEDDRHYNLWCRYIATCREDQQGLPSDFEPRVLYERRYAFEWMHGLDAWDDVQCNA